MVAEALRLVGSKHRLARELGYMSARDAGSPIRFILEGRQKRMSYSAYLRLLKLLKEHKERTRPQQ